jgi:2-polyprenyl-6-methoxyphenol hydroxylase-like FAD-dependent oxidoreductase
MDLGGQALAGDAGTPQVLVIGAGPTGMITACELLRRGVQVRVVDAAPDPVPYCKALLLWPRTIDVLAELGLADEVPRRGIRINAFRYYGITAAQHGGHAPGQAGGARWPHRARCSAARVGPNGLFR